MDRREVARHKTAAYHILYDRDTGKFVGRLTNLTSSGLRMISDREILIPDLVHCRMRLPDTFNGVREIEFDIESRWCQYNRTGDWYDAGYVFVGLTDLARGAIAAMIRDWPRETDLLPLKG